MIPECNQKFKEEKQLLLEVENVNEGSKMIESDLKLIEQREEELVFEKKQLMEELADMKFRP